MCLFWTWLGVTHRRHTGQSTPALTHFNRDLAGQNILGLTQSVLDLSLAFANGFLLCPLSRAQGVPRERLPVVPKNASVKCTNQQARKEGGEGSGRGQGRAHPTLLGKKLSNLLKH